MLSAASISNNQFISTTSPAHQQTVHQLWVSILTATPTVSFILQQRLERSGFIYRGCYEGWYSVNDEAFYSSDDVSAHCDY